MNIKLATGESIPAAAGESILSALKKKGIYLVSSCGGKGTCGKCRIKIHSGKHRTSTSGKLSQADKEKGIVLACRTFPENDVSAEILEEARLVVGDRIALAKSKDLSELFRSF